MAIRTFMEALERRMASFMMLSINKAERGEIGSELFLSALQRTKHAMQIWYTDHSGLLYIGHKRAFISMHSCMVLSSCVPVKWQPLLPKYCLNTQVCISPRMVKFLRSVIVL